VIHFANTCVNRCPGSGSVAGNQSRVGRQH